MSTGCDSTEQADCHWLPLIADAICSCPQDAIRQSKLSVRGRLTRAEGAAPARAEVDDFRLIEVKELADGSKVGFIKRPQLHNRRMPSAHHPLPSTHHPQPSALCPPSTTLQPQLTTHRLPTGHIPTSHPNAQHSLLQVVAYTVMGTGTLELQVELAEGAPIPGSPFEVAVLAGPLDAARSTAVGGCLHESVVGERASFVIHARDRIGNLRNVAGYLPPAQRQMSSEAMGAGES